MRIEATTEKEAIAKAGRELKKGLQIGAKGVKNVEYLETNF